jgi:MFS family permease
VAILCLGQIVFAIGETIWQPVSPALVNDLSPEHLRGRYNAFIGIVWAGSGAIGQLGATVFIQYGEGRLWTLCLAGGAILGGLGLTTMRKVLTPLEDGLVLPEPAL